jgi:DNA (cytosine-5)-methyltransferase 1
VKYLSICSGIEAASVAWHDLPWQAVGFSEIEPFPCALLQHRFPAVPNFGDMTRHADWNIEPGAVDLVVGGTPCQAFSVAGLRAGMADPRGNLALTFLAIVDRLRPQWVVWENVPGVLSSNGGRDFGAFLGALVELGYGFAYRVLDAQHFGVAQRRRRVFVVANATDWRRAAAVLFEPESLHGDTPKGRAKGQGAAASTAGRTDEVCSTVTSKWAKGSGGPAGDECQNLVAAPFVVDRAAFNQGVGAQYAPRIEASETMSAIVAKGPHAVGVDLFNNNTTGSIHVPLRTAGGHGAPAVLVSPPEPTYPINTLSLGDPQFTLQAAHCHAVAQAYAVRRLTPTECERLQGFPDDWTAIPYRGKPAADGPRYKAIGNSMAVPVMRWLGERIDAVDKATKA